MRKVQQLLNHETACKKGHPQITVLKRDDFTNGSLTLDLDPFCLRAKDFEGGV